MRARSSIPFSRAVFRWRYWTSILDSAEKASNPVTRNGSWNRAEALPYSVNCFVLPPHSLDDAAARFASLVSRPGVLNAAFSMWELPQVSEVWHPALQMFDVLVAGSPFIRHSFAFSLPEAMVIDAPLFLPLRSRVTADRKRFGLAGDICYCIASFEPLSAGERKNVKAVVAAFQAAVTAAPNLNLIIKVNNPSPRGVEHRALAQLRQACAGIPGVRFITDTLASFGRAVPLCQLRYLRFNASLRGVWPGNVRGHATGQTGHCDRVVGQHGIHGPRQRLPDRVTTWSRFRCGGAGWPTFLDGYRRPVQWAERQASRMPPSGLPGWRVRASCAEEKGAAALAAIAAYQASGRTGGVLR